MSCANEHHIWNKGLSKHHWRCLPAKYTKKMSRYQKLLKWLTKPPQTAVWSVGKTPWTQFFISIDWPNTLFSPIGQSKKSTNIKDASQKRPFAINLSKIRLTKHSFFCNWSVKSQKISSVTKEIDWPNHPKQPFSQSKQSRPPLKPSKYQLYNRRKRFETSWRNRECSGLILS